MSKVVAAKVEVDLTPLGQGKKECAATVQFDDLDRPEELVLSVPGLPPEQIVKLTQGPITHQKVFGATDIIGRLADGTGFEGSIVFLKGVGFGSEQEGVQIRCYLGQYRVKPSGSASDRRTWVFRLANLRLSIGDVMTPLPAPKGALDPGKVEQFKSLANQWHKRFEGRELSPEELEQKYGAPKVTGGVRRNRINFQYAGRMWHLDDDLHGQWPDRLDKIGSPILSGTLSTTVQEGDSDGSLQESGTDITELLTFALARDVKWVSFGCQDAEGRYCSLIQRNPGVLPFNQHGFAVIDNWEFGNLKTFLEGAEAQLRSAREWWSVTVGLLTQARASKYMEVKCSLLNTLLDRTSTKVNGDSHGPEIDPLLEKRIDRKWWRLILHLVLRCLSSKWERHRTDSLCDNVIKGWNSSPSFPEKIIRSCDTLGIPAPSRTKLGFRHKLIHAGELDSKLKTVEKRAEYLFSIEAVACLLLVRLFEFKGYIYLKAHNHQHRRVEDVLAGTQA